MKCRLALAGAIATMALAAFPAAGSATSIPGPNGKIAFTSGRPTEDVPAPNAGDAGARIFVADYPSGTPVQVTTLPAGATVRHRQPNWSPDHTRIAYAGGSGTTYAIWILDLRDGSQTEFVSGAAGLDRPSWSPDGTQIAYGAGGHLWVKDVDDTDPADRGTELTNSADTDERPVWSPDGNTLYFNRKGTAMGATLDIYKKSPVTPGGKVEGVATGSGEDWQPAVSPDGQRLCFLRGGKDDTATLRTINVNGTGDTPFVDDSNRGDLNCVWSPDGSRILYTEGAFPLGELRTRDINGGTKEELTGFNVAEHFDGNADWATNFPPKCDSKDAHIGVNQFVTITLSCTDPDFGFGAEPPTPTPLESDALEIAMPPSHGTIGGLSDDGKVIYTPNKDFQGTDAFTYRGTDGTSEAVPASVTIQVGNQPAGDRTPPSISAIKVSAKRWRLGNSLAKISKAPVGTTISFKLSESAKATLTFQSARAGRKSGKNCVKQTAANKSRPKCTRYVNAGSINLNAKAGQSKVKFQGLITRSRKLSLGSYRVVVGARDAAGNKSSRNGPTFTIVGG
jgi:Tol biopolymer transport system component